MKITRQITGNHPQCEDRFLLWEGFLQGTYTRAVIIADGHGAAWYVRSARGTELVCETMKTLLEENHPLDKAFRTLLKDRFDSAVWADLEAHPLTDEEKYILWLNNCPNFSPFRTYGTTLMVAVLTTESTFLLQIGDGTMKFLSEDGDICSLLSDPYSIGTVTSSMIFQHAYFFPRLRGPEKHPPTKALIAFTDGCPPECADEILAAYNHDPSRIVMERVIDNALTRYYHGDDQTLVFLTCDSAEP